MLRNRGKCNPLSRLDVCGGTGSEFVIKVKLDLEDRRGDRNDIDAGEIYFYIPGDASASNPFSSNTSNTSAPTTPSKPVFTDVVATAYYAESVAWAVEQGITSGSTANTFSPHNAWYYGANPNIPVARKGFPRTHQQNEHAHGH